MILSHWALPDLFSTTSISRFLICRTLRLRDFLANVIRILEVRNIISEDRNTSGKRRNHKDCVKEIRRRISDKSPVSGSAIEIQEKVREILLENGIITNHWELKTNNVSSFKLSFENLSDAPIRCCTRCNVRVTSVPYNVCIMPNCGSKEFTSVQGVEDFYRWSAEKKPATASRSRGIETNQAT